MGLDCTVRLFRWSLQAILQQFYNGCGWVCEAGRIDGPHLRGCMVFLAKPRQMYYTVNSRGVIPRLEPPIRDNIIKEAKYDGYPSIHNET